MPRLISGASTGLVPSCSARGMASSSSFSTANANFSMYTAFGDTDSNNLGLLTSSGYCEIPQGFSGKYQFTFFTNGISTADYNTAWVYYYDCHANSYEIMILDYSSNDYSNYTCGGTHILDMKHGDRMYFGYDSRYGTPLSTNYYSRMSMQFLKH